MALRSVSRRKWRMWRDALLFVTPFVLLYLLFFIYPTFRVFQLSLTEAPLIGEGRFIGLENYRRLMEDRLFWRSLRNTFYFVLLTVIPNTFVGLLFALMVIRLKRLRSVVLAAFFLPYMLPVSVVTLVWQWLLNPQFGILQPVFQLFTGESIAVFTNRTWAMPSVAFITVWWTVGFNMLLFISGLQGISKEYYEAASLDGANGLQKFGYITWPLLWPITALVLMLQLIAQLKIFDQMYLLTGGGPFNSTMVTLQYMYREAFQRFDGGYSSTIAMALFIIILVASLLQYRFLRAGGQA
ncbi:MAG: sugar ABC transporter permease [Deinococcota bacterium]